MEASEVMGWRLWLAQEPRGSRRADWQAAQISQAVYTVIRSFSGGDPITLNQCLLSFDNNPSKVVDQTRKNAQAAMALIFGKDHKDGVGKLKEDLEKLTAPA